ncbi:LamG-like jellyroll fold domain-containing protein [Pedobacter africanus]|uniref:Concanavalin A-like lectin/glucanases superfamily protein n=1 Tax=Pedobacter africanus TaxID=151894 RepID=A0A1W2C2I3_9SPHI|nr:LamG-like jellyroll fold domain-containing protein [Pedobacter africanus]SMC79316.1 Concanavalin A-like lectin/glucanases superfamily protein [Pedobacter africanus]
MKFSNLYKIGWVIGIVILTVGTSCKKDGNPNNLPDVSPDDYAGKIDGFTSSDEVFPKNLVAYWSFDDTKAEKVSGASPTTSANDAFIAAGVRGKALSLTTGYLYYANQFNTLKTDVFKSFSISTWVQILNNGSKKTMLFQLTRPGIFTGSINFILNTNAFPASNTDELKINPTFTTIGGGTQDNVNTKRDNPGDINYFPYLSPKIGMSKWTHILLTYNGTTGFFYIWADGVQIGAFSSRGTGNNLFKSNEPSEVIIGGNYNVIPGKSVSTDQSFAAMTGNIDEIRIYNIALPEAHVKALFNLGKAGK